MIFIAPGPLATPSVGFMVAAKQEIRGRERRKGEEEDGREGRQCALVGGEGE